MQEWVLDPDRYFSAVPSVRSVARTLYESIRNLPLVCPHGHVPPALLSDPGARLRHRPSFLSYPITTSRACFTLKGFL